MHYDGTYQKLFSNPEMLEDLVKHFVNEDWVSDLDFSTVERLSSKFISKELTRCEGDLIFKINTFQGEPTYLVLLLEFQSTSDHWMAIRFLVYTGLLYQELIKNKQLVKGLLPPVFPLLLYNGNPNWNAATEVKQLIDLPKNSKLWPYQPHLRYYVIDENVHLSSDSNSLSSLLFKLDKIQDDGKINQYFEELTELLKSPGLQQVTRDFFTWVHHVFEPKRQLELNFGQIESISEARDMLKETVQRWQQEYIQAGMQQGLQQGLHQGMQQGEEKGIVLGEIKIIERMLSKRFGPTPPDIHQKIQNATSEELEEWSMRILEAKSIDDVFKY